MESINQYIDNELYILVPVLYALGAAVKKSEVKDKWIPLILGLMGILLATAYKCGVYGPKNISEFVMLFYSGITQGILCAASSVYANNIIKQMKKDETDEEDTKGDSADNGDFR